MNRFLSPSTLVAVRQVRVAVLGSSVRVDIDLDAPPAPAPPPRVAMNISGLAFRLGIEDVGGFTKLLCQAGLLEPIPSARNPRSRQTKKQHISLAEALRDLAAGKDLTRLLVVTSDEALWTGHDPELAAVALGVFVARFADWPRRAVYGAVLSGTAELISADLPSPEALDLADTPTTDEPHAVAVDLRTGQRSGILTSVAEALGPDGGRLAVAASLTRTRFGTGPGAIIHVSAIAADPPSLPDPFYDSPFGLTGVGGGAADSDLAELKCCSEAAEFLISGGTLPADAVRARPMELDGPWMSPADLVSYGNGHRSRLGVRPFDPEEPQWWVPGARAGQRIWLPAPLVCGRTPDPPSWFHPTAASSSGVAAHPVLETAIRSAWLEAVERDAFQRCRAQAGAAVPARLEPTSLPAAQRRILWTLTRIADVAVLRLTTPTGLPVVLVRTDTAERMGLGCAAAHDPAVALERALIEATGQVSASVNPIENPAQVRTPLDHAGLYSQPGWRSRLDWMLAGPSIRFTDIPGAEVRQIPRHAAVYNFPKPFPLPVQVVRVLDPTLIPITFGYDSDPDGRADFAQAWRRSGRDLDAPLEPHPLA